jgi:hypothetical protein
MAKPFADFIMDNEVGNIIYFVRFKVLTAVTIKIIF